MKTPIIIDSHTHIPTADYEGGNRFFKAAEPAIAYLRATGTQAAVFTTWRGVNAATEVDLNAGNEAALALARDSDGFLYPGAVIHPLFPDASLQWLARFRDLGFMWVGELLPSCPFADAQFLRLFESCAKHGHIVQLHNSTDTKSVAAHFPEMPVVCAHIPEEAECQHLAALPNVWMDLSGSNGGLKMGGMETARDTMGADRLVYGSDFTVYEPRAFMARLNMVLPSPADQEKVSHQNIVRLLAKVRSRPIL